MHDLWRPDYRRFHMVIPNGVAGAGTIVCVALVGPVAGIFLPLNERMIEGCMKRIMS